MKASAVFESIMSINTDVSPDCPDPHNYNGKLFTALNNDNSCFVLELAFGLENFIFIARYTLLLKQLYFIFLRRILLTRIILFYSPYTCRCRP